MEYEIAWSGCLEAAGACAGLSAYQGRSSLWHSPNWEKLDALEHGEAKGDSPTRWRGQDKQTRSRRRDPVRDAAILASLRVGASYGAITRTLDVTAAIVRRVARAHGINRAGFNQYGRRS